MRLIFIAALLLSRNVILQQNKSSSGEGVGGYGGLLPIGSWPLDNREVASEFGGVHGVDFF